MQRSSECASSFIQELFNVVQKLAALDLVVASLHCNYGAFGSWSIVIERRRESHRYGEALLNGGHDTMGPDAIRFIWDGRDERLSIMSAPTKPPCAPGPWQTVLEQGFANSSAAIEVAASYARRWGNEV